MIDEPTVPPTTDAYDPARQREVLGQVAEALAARRLAAPAIFALEASKPLSVVASQALWFFRPVVQALLPLRDYEVFAAALENRDNIEWFIQQLEACEEREWQQRRQPPATEDSSDVG